MTVKLSGIAPTRKMLQDIERFISSTKPMKEITDDAIDIIKDKTESGLDYMHRRFEPYSSAYAKKKGRSKVNLRVTGQMLGSIVRKIINAYHGRIFIRGRRAVVGAVHNKGTRKMPQREFMNLSKSAIAKLAKKHYDDKLMKIMGRR